MPRFDVTTLGESMLRLSVPVGRPLELAAQLDVHLAGSESNALAALASLGHRCSWVSSLPDNAVGRLAGNQLRLRDIDLSGVIWKSDCRLGTFYVELGAPPRATQVIYDRADSCTSHLTPDQIDWDHLLDTRLLHLTGITPALSANCHGIIREAVERAQGAGIPLSFDINHRHRLWSPSEAAQILLPLLQGVALLFCARRDAELLFGFSGTPEEMILQLEKETSAGHIVLSIGAGGVVGWDGQHTFRQPAYEATLIDALGAGDALAAGVIHGWLEGDFARGLKMGAALAAMALSQEGDMVVVTPSALEDILHSGQREVRR